jgi:D-3-phosphoglycerate dehydrogenase / 2-oxoglutarate reductase
MTSPWRVFMSSPPARVDAFRAIEDAGCDVSYGLSVEDHPEKAYTEDELIALLQDVDVYVCMTREGYNRRIAEACPNLLMIVKPIIGFDNIDLAAATDAGVLVANSPAPENFIGVAEAAVGLMIALSKRLLENRQVLLNGEWKRDELFGDLLYDKTVGIVGLARVGGHVAQRLGPWGMRLIAYDPYITQDRAQSFGAELRPTLESVLDEADFVTLHTPLTAETRGMIGEPQLRRMKPSAFLLNTARGAVIDEHAVARAIEERWIAGAAIDVFDPEPLSHGSPLRELDQERVILTPHSVGNSYAARMGGQRLAVQTITQAMRGEVPEYVVNPAVVERWRERMAARG